MGAVPLVSLIQARGNGGVAKLVQRGDTALELGDDLPEVARLMTDFNLSVAPIVDDGRRIVGVISVDDVLEAILPIPGDAAPRRARLRLPSGPADPPSGDGSGAPGTLVDLRRSQPPEVQSKGDSGRTGAPSTSPAMSWRAGAKGHACKGV